MSIAIFLDRDGVINEVLSERVRFVNKPKDFHLLEGAGEAIKLLNQAGYLVFVVTNQGGVGLGYMKESMLVDVHKKMEKDLAHYGAMVNDIAYCPHKPYEGCICRKPNPGMILQLAEQHQIDLDKSYMVGDREPDIEAGKKAGVKTVLVGVSKERANADLYFPDLLQFAKWLTKGH
ncbi:HAD family hydrolase [Oceanobacillus piezotolerans]|uniref:D,D-heptose 1,7-bisphosphate phosphatase n=1 Tax=Oceanobacillus piezotolerans TaxID=2448030 RepID=A0A498D432_9BACI|nr:HAD family hydrolase [Oceanobacillus piezotolerans]RLL42719.1 HAD family hydrolase [Oceanobacillus piezotolerans]